MSPKLLNILIIILPVILYLGYIDPMFNGTSGLFWTPEKSLPILKSENYNYSQALEQISFIDGEIKKLNKDYINIDPKIIEKVNMMLPDDIDQLKLRSEVVSIGNKSGVALENVSVVKDIKNKEPNIAAYIVTINFKARYPLFKKFVQNYEKSLRFFNHENVTIKKMDAKDLNNALGNEQIDPEKLMITMTSKVYYLKK